MATIMQDNGLFKEDGVPSAIRGIGSLEDAIRVHARLDPDRPAITFHDRTISYGSFDKRTNRLANALLSAGYGAQDRLAVVLKNGPCSYESLIAARKIGAVQVAINWRLAPSEIAWIVNDCRSRILILDADLADKAAEIAAMLDRPIEMLVAGDAGMAGLASVDEWIARFSDTDPGRTSAFDETAIQLYTSGTTGRPKGAMLSNGNLWSFFDNAARVLPMRAFGNHLIVLPLFHVAALIWSMRVFVHGGHCIGMREFDPDAMLSLIPRYRVNDFATVTTVLYMLQRHAPRDLDYSSLEGICVGGGMLSERSAREMMETFGCPIYGMYGSTELTYGCTLLWIDEALLETPELLDSCGRPFPDITLGIFDPESEQALPDGVIGELWVRGGQRGQGYWNRPEETAKAFRPDGWFRTGDMGHLRDGYLYISDRLKDMIRSGGENVYPAEVERVLGEHPAIQEAVVIGVPDDIWGESVKALIILREGRSAEPAEVISYARGHLAPFKCPRSVEFVEGFPRTPSGKPMKNVIREPYWERYSRRVN
ncbi:AMP-binding protein [Sphingomonas sp. YL-JM2C]